MSQTAIKKTNRSRVLVSALLILLCVALAAFSVFGYIHRGSEKTALQLNNMRTHSVLHAASSGLIDNIVTSAAAAKLKELRDRPDFRSMGSNAKDALIAEAEEAARTEAEAKYSNTEGADMEALEVKIDALETALNAYHAQENSEKAVYADLYTELYNNVADWTDLVGEADDDGLFTALCEAAPALAEESNAYLRGPMTAFARAQAEAEAAADEEAFREELIASVTASVSDWSAYAELDDEALWAELGTLVPDLASYENYKSDILAAAKEQIEAAASGEASAEGAEEGTEEIAEETFTVSYKYFSGSEDLAALEEASEAAYDDLWAELTATIPDLAGLEKKMFNSIRETIEEIVYSGAMDFSDRYDMYASQEATGILNGSDAFAMKVAAIAEPLLLAAIAIALLAIVFIFWKQLVAKLGVPRTIITLFFIYLLLAARFYSMNVSLLLGNVLERVSMYGILALAMLPGIQCGIGLNMGMTLGCIAGLLSTVIALQYNMTGATALFFAIVAGALIAVPLGWAYSLLLNRMKGSEMTIATYVGYSFVSIMCIAWLLLPFNNTKIIWLLSGRGLRVTHSLLDSFAYILDRFLEFEIFGITVPTGGLLFFLLMCFIMWIFSRSKLGIAMTATGSNPSFAQACGINVDRMRTLGTILSTVLAAIGIVVYSQSFGYAQLYTAPRQLGFIAASAILIGGATVSRAKVSNVVVGVFLFEGILSLGQQVANAAISTGGMSEVMRILISNGIILYALTQSGGASRD